MLRFAGNTATRVAISHHPAQDRVRGTHQTHAAGDLGDTAREDELAVGRQEPRHHRLIGLRNHEVQRTRDDEGLVRRRA